MPVVFRSSGALDTGNAEALVLRCSAARVQMHTAEFLHDALGLEKYCLIAIPGGVHAFVTPNHLPLAGWILWRWLRFLVNLYRPPRILLIAHQDCAWYNALPHWLKRKGSETQLVEDLRSAGERVRKQWPQSRVELYYMRREGDEVLFEAV